MNLCTPDIDNSGLIIQNMGFGTLSPIMNVSTMSGTIMVNRSPLNRGKHHDDDNSPYYGAEK